MAACGSDDIKNALNDEENTSDTVEDPNNSTDNNGDENDPNNQNDPNDSNNQNDPNDPNNQNDPNDPNNQNDPNDPNNQNDPNDPNNQNDPNDPNNQNDPTTDPTADPAVVDPCNPNQCLSIEHSDGVCTATEAGSEELFTCGCVNDILGNYMWYDGKCRQVVSKHQCQLLAEFVQANFTVPDWVTDVVEFVCYCFTDQCVIIWEP